MKSFVKTTLVAAGLALAAGSLHAAHQHASAPTLLALFDGSKNEFPEAMAADHHGNVYLSLVFAGKIKKVTAAGIQSDYASVPDNWLLGMTFDEDDNLVVLGASGVWKVSPEGVVTLFSSVPGHGFLNDLAYDSRGNLYVTDSFAYRIWKIDPHGAVSIWSEDVLLQGKVSQFPNTLGPNGIRYDRETRSLVVANTSAGRIIRIDLKRNGRAGEGRIVAEDERLVGVDGIELAEQGEVLAAVNIQDRIARVDAHGKVTDLAVDGLLSTPTALVSVHRRGAELLYICNNGNIFFSPTQAGEGVLKMPLTLHGQAWKSED